MVQRRLRKTQKNHVLKGLAELKMTSEVIKSLQKHFPDSDFVKTISPEAIDYYRRTHAEDIERLRAGFLERLSEIPISTKYARLQVIQALVDDLRQRLEWMDDDGVLHFTNHHATIGQLLGLARQEMTEVVVDAKDNIYINQQIKQYFIATGEQISAEQVMELTPADWKELHEPVEKQKALPSGSEDKADVEQSSKGETSKEVKA